MIALALVCMNQSQLNQRQAMAAIRNDTQLKGLLSIGPEIQTYFLQRDNLDIIRRGRPRLAWLEAAMQALRKNNRSVNRLISYKPEHNTIAEHLKAVNLQCNVKQELPGWWLDRLIFKGNPRHNRRRATIELWHCQDPVSRS